MGWDDDEEDEVGVVGGLVEVGWGLVDVDEVEVAGGEGQGRVTSSLWL